jgi:hypothetical protein
MMNERKPHPAAELFPLMSASDLQSLADDIKANGLLEAIALHEGLILDGRNRYAACRMAEVEPRFVEAELNGQSPALFVISKNIYRRHLTTSQRGAISVRLILMLEPDAKKRQQEAGKEHGRGQKNSLAYKYAKLSLNGKSAAQAAQALGVGVTTVEHAFAIWKTDRLLFERVRRGEISVKTTYNKLRTTPQSTPRRSRSSVADPTACEAFYQRLCGELRARRERIEGKRIGGRWMPENIARLDLLDLLDWIENELTSFSGHSVNRREDANPQPIGIGA